MSLWWSTMLQILMLQQRSSIFFFKGGCFKHIFKPGAHEIYTVSTVPGLSAPKISVINSVTQQKKFSSWVMLLSNIRKYFWRTDHLHQFILRSEWTVMAMWRNLRVHENETHGLHEIQGQFLCNSFILLLHLIQWISHSSCPSTCNARRSSIILNQP